MSQLSEIFINLANEEKPVRHKKQGLKDSLAQIKKIQKAVCDSEPQQKGDAYERAHTSPKLVSQAVKLDRPQKHENKESHHLITPQPQKAVAMRTIAKHNRRLARDKAKQTRWPAGQVQRYGCE